MIIWSHDTYRDGGTLSFKAHAKLPNSATEICVGHSFTRTQSGPRKITWGYPTGWRDKEGVKHEAIDLSPAEIEEFRKALIEYAERTLYAVNEVFKVMKEEQLYNAEGIQC